MSPSFSQALRLLIGLSGLCSVTNGFATPKADFLLNIDGGSVASSLYSICAIEQKQGEEIGGRAKCWGYNDDDESVVATTPADITFIQLTHGNGFACGIAIDQTLHCWGSIRGQVPGLYTQVSADSNGYFGCGVLIDGTIECFGQSRFHHMTPRHPDRRYLQVSCGWSHCCAIDSNGYPHCWANAPHNKHLLLPTITYKEYTQSRKSAGFLLKNGGTGSDEGTNGELDPDMYEEEGDDGELLADSVDGSGDSSRDHEVSLVQFRQISVNEEMSCGITLLGANVLCWGPSLHFRRGTMPRQVKGPFRQLSVGDHGFCAITADYDEIFGGESQDGEGETQTDAGDGEERREPDQLVCYGMVAMTVDPKRFEAWDQISLDSQVCGVSMESELECWSHTLLPQHKTVHRDIVIA